MILTRFRSAGGSQWVFVTVFSVSLGFIALDYQLYLFRDLCIVKLMLFPACKDKRKRLLIGITWLIKRELSDMPLSSSKIPAAICIMLPLALTQELV